jgi:predicted TIM-barrel fold metal-dependent hydrolase
MIVDFHVHLADTASLLPAVLALARSFAPGNGFDEVLDEAGNTDPQKYLAYMDRVGVDYTVVIPGPTTLDWVGKNCLGYERLLPFYTINPRFTFKPEKALEKAIGRGFRGLKLYPTYLHFYPNEPFLYPIYAKAQELEIPVLFHTGSSIFPNSRIKFGNPLYFDDLMVDFPNLNVVMAHSGRGFWYEEAFFLSKLHRNLYMEISGLPVKKLLQLFPEMERNADKIVFGSDWYASPGAGQMLKDFRELPISEEVKDKILGMNAARLLKLI